MVLPVLGLLGSFMQARSQIAAGRQRERDAKLDAIQIELQKRQSGIIAQQNHNTRLAMAWDATSANRAFDGFRNVEGQSVDAQIRGDMNVVDSDINRMLSDATIRKIQLQTQADRRREEGRYARRAAGMSAFSTMLGGISNYNMTS
tara:strand:+ start:21354 stop:21791 length:438 start_codon:yes stop_codon:yes gene_type:complete